jgi:hypothetical protein
MTDRTIKRISGQQQPEITRMEAKQQQTEITSQPHVVKTGFLSSVFLSGITFITFNCLAMMVAGIMSALYFRAKRQPSP